MAKAILGFFGGASILVGVLILALGFQSRGEGGNAAVLAIGCSFLIAGAPLLGFARVIELLERIAANTAARAAVPAGVEPSEALQMPQPMQAPTVRAAPRPGRLTTAAINRQTSYRGRAYDVHEDGVVVAAAAGRPATWNSEAEFQAWADQLPTQA